MGSPLITLMKERRFANLIARGHSVTEAGLAVGFSPRSVGPTSSRFANKPRVRQLIEAECARLQKRREISLSRQAEEFASMSLASMDRYVSLTPDGDPYVDLSKADEVDWRAVQSIEIDEYVEGRGDNARDVKKIKLKLYDKNAAGMNLSKLMGWVKDAGKASDDTTIEQKEDLGEIARRLAFVMRRGQRQIEGAATIVEPDKMGDSMGSDENQSKEPQKP